jgi:hypothetical protein
MRIINMLLGVTKRTYGKYEKNLSTLGKGITVSMKDSSSVSDTGSKGSPWRGKDPIIARVKMCYLLDHMKKHKNWVCRYI